MVFGKTRAKIMSRPAVSVLMTAYNRERYIAEAIESVLTSTFTDFELVVVDDVSSDRTVDIAQSYTSDPRVCVHVNEKNLGDYTNRNRAAELARGRFLKYVDADDYIYPHGLGVMVETMLRHPEAAAGLAVPQDMARYYPFQLTPEEAYQNHFFGGGIFSKAPLSAIFDAELFREVGGFCTSEGPRGDYEMWLRIGARYPLVLMPNGLVWWRAHEQQETEYRRARSGEDLSRQYLLTLGALTNPGCPLRPRDRARAIHKVKRAQARQVLRLVSRLLIGMAWDIYSKSGLSIQDLSAAWSAPKLSR